ncbi:malate dehydrogenase (quinone) [Marixanthomonas ophiurae]|uniref:Probable malate:quinone oxidoreductase n=1 Tax=Marixanthomonas ophiurae TaxID=387659 RepID=A0A3E1Q8M5_9FLAO|nr:malate dehydrogenase (quinone) [Marixanthomonas ophiurae]RFN58479.1 malate dehydrogenase (quinone) [Marixanthomonas ophiurae]
MDSAKINKDYDLICVGGGIMSATLALMAKILKPELKVLILEKLSKVAQESSAAWNNAGTGHSALCELNYTPENKDGSIDISKAISICNQFEISKQFWSYLVNTGHITDPKSFIHNVPHHSWVTGKANADYLEKRYHAMKDHYMFQHIEFTKDQEIMKKWFPLIMHNRKDDEPMAASRIDRGTEVNYGVLTKKLFDILEKDYNTPVQCSEEVLDIDPDKGVEWSVKVKNTQTGNIQHLDAEHVFIGAGGGSLLLLEKVEIDEKDGYGGFPVSGQWLVCKNEDVINQHHAKVYSKAGLGDPPMSVPHLDTRYIDGKRELLFGPFAGFSPKFLKEGSNLDLFKSINFKNIPSMLGGFWHNLPLTKYLIEQVTMSFDDRMDDLRKFVKDAKNEDWHVVIAGQRVQIIKRDEYEGGRLQFGTEVVSSKDGSITCLLGASAGASTAVKIMLDVLEKAFPEVIHSNKGKELLQKMVPTWNTQVDETSFNTQLKQSEQALKL